MPSWGILMPTIWEDLRRKGTVHTGQSGIEESHRENPQESGFALKHRSAKSRWPGHIGLTVAMPFFSGSIPSRSDVVGRCLARLHDEVSHRQDCDVRRVLERASFCRMLSLH
jgi:hypothetical protein